MKSYKVELIVHVPDDKVPKNLDWITQEDFNDYIQEWFLCHLKGKPNTIPADNILQKTPIQYNPFSVCVHPYE